LQQSLFSGRLFLGVAKDHAKNWWTLSAESRGKPLATLFSYFPFALALAVVIAAFVTFNFTWLVAVPLGAVAMFLGSPMNPGRFVVVALGAALFIGGWLAGWSSLVVSGGVVLLIYAAMQLYYGLGKRAFQRFLISDSDGFAKYWDMGIVMLKDVETGHVYSHDEPEERLRSTLSQ
jgi:hypothetical protein